MKFDEFKFNPLLLRVIKEIRYINPTPIQMQAIPAILQGKDILATAQTGTGKTASFVLPLANLLTQQLPVKSNHVYALILTPTRELAAQVQQSIQQYTKYLSLRSFAVFGGVKINPQMQALCKGVEILVATPGRLLDLSQQNAVRFAQIKFLVLDEADRMLDMGFINDIKKIISKLPIKRQNLLFSATFSDPIRQLAKRLLCNPLEIDIAKRNATAVKIQQMIHPVDKTKKPLLLSYLIRKNNWQQVLVFVRTKHMSNKLVKLLIADKIVAIAIHGNKSQAQRIRALEDFKNRKIAILVATDIAARGLDIEQLPLVINFELPQVAEDYVHRIGRTGRAGGSGSAISLVCADEYKHLRNIEILIKSKLRRVEITEFSPSHNLP